MSGVVERIFDGTFSEVSEEEYRELVEDAVDVLEGKNLVEKDWKKFVVVGDTHGDLDAVKVPVNEALEIDLPIVFLGDYVDRGEDQLESLAFVLNLKVQRPGKVVLLRGNHETERMNRRYGFTEVLNKRYSLDLYEVIKSVYRKLPATAVINGDHFLAHGGIPKGVKNVEEIKGLKHGDQAYKELFWNDPNKEIKNFEMNFIRGGYNMYGEKAVKEFLHVNDLKMIIRAHQCFKQGFRYFFDYRVLSIFSVPDYCGNKVGKYAVVEKDEVNLYDIRKR
ncbi:MAG: metallophosphoesterase [Candidatus Saliniplasma sp.]